MIKMEQLFYISEVSKCNSISKTAESLYMTSAAISTAIKQLEKECGYEILERTYRGVKLTEKGKFVVKQAKKILALQNEILDLNSENKHEEQYELVINSTTLKLFANKILGPGSKVLKHFKIVEVDDVSKNYIRYLNEKTVVLVVVSENVKKNFEEDERINICYYYESKSYPVSCKNTKWVKNNRNYISKEEFADLPKILMRSGVEMNTNNVVLATDDSAIYSEAIRNDYGVGLLAQFAPDVHAVDCDEYKIYEPFDDKVYVAALTSKNCDKKIDLFLEKLIKG